MTKQERKNIIVTTETWERLRKYGNFGDSYEDIIIKLINEFDDKIK